MLRKIIHIDMDAFFAAVEQRDNPSLRGKPVIVGGDPDKRGVVSTCSYEARKYGVHSAMASKTAVRLCPQGIFVRPRFEAYKEASIQVFDIFRSYTQLVESLSLDEAYLDVTDNYMGISSATEIARKIQKEIYSATRLTASAGVSFNKFLAKAASDYIKPHGLTVVPPEKAQAFVDSLPVGKFHGIGKVTEKRMRELGIETGKDLRSYDLDFMISHFGKIGEYYYFIARGIDRREVEPVRIRKSIGKETTLSRDITDIKAMHEILRSLTIKVSDYMQRTQRKGKTVTLKIKYDNFESITRSMTVDEPTNSRDVIFGHLTKLLRETEAGRRKVRLLGLSLSNLDGVADNENEDQMMLPFL